MSRTVGNWLVSPIPVTKNFTPLCYLDEFKENLNAYAWLWKDHTGFAESEKITELARKEYPEYLTKCGGTYPSEFYYSKILHCLRTDPKVFEATYSWIELCDYVPVMLGGITRQEDIKNSRCAAGHKALFANEWGGLPQRKFLAKLDPGFEIPDTDEEYNIKLSSFNFLAAQKSLKPDS